MEHLFTVSSKEAGQRIDKWLCSKLPKLSRKQIKALMDSGQVQINSRRVVIAGWQLEEGDCIEVNTLVRPSKAEELGQKLRTTPEQKKVKEHKAGHSKIGASIERYLQRKRGPTSDEPEKERRRLKVYYEDRDLIVVEKPAGMLSVPGPAHKGAHSLQTHIKEYLKRRYKRSKDSFLAPLHRLDTETSGIMVFALSRIGQKLSRQFKNHSIDRTYQAIVSGPVKTERGIIDRSLEKGRFEHGRKARLSRNRTGRRAITEYRVKERYKDATLLDIRVRTGRTHQIRVHLASEGHPILGDATYDERHVQTSLGFRRHALHAHSLSFKHPASGKRISYRSSLPHDMKDLIDKLREQS